MRNYAITATAIAIALTFSTSCKGNKEANGDNEEMRPLKEAVGDRFLIGTAMNTRQINGEDSAAVNVVKRHFNSIVAENCMKSEVIHPKENEYHFSAADSLVAFGEENGMAIIGHCLVWHSQLAKWFTVDDTGKPVTAQELKDRMREHILTVVGRYRGRIKGWDVVNEAFLDDGSYRPTPFYNIIGEEYIALAFKWANEADPNAELYYNDYGMDKPGRREAVVKLVKSLKEQGIRIDAVGMQSHIGMDYPEMDEYEATIEALQATGVNVMITEWELSALPTIHTSANISEMVDYSERLDPYPNGLPEEVSKEWNDRMNEFFQLYLKHSDVITRVTAWGVSDGDSWKNDYPVRGRTDYPLLFDRNYEPKQFIKDFCSGKETTK